MKYRFCGIALMFCCVVGYAAQVTVQTSAQLMAVCASARAGDTILVLPGEYTGSTSKSGDPGNLPNGRGYFWIGSDATADHPIAVIGSDPANPPVLSGGGVSTAGYVFHVTGDHVVLKNLVLTSAEKGVVFDNASYGILEDCEVFNVGAELVHIRDASSNCVISRNLLHGSGNGGNGSIGEGIYIGTDQDRWGADDLPQSQWGSKAISEGYGGYDWRVDNTQVLCNYLSGGISAECMDIKEGTRYTIVTGNMLVGDSIARKPGAQSYDDSYIDMKGVLGTFTQNRFWAGDNKVTKYIAEVDRSSYPHIPPSLTADGSSSPWCDAADADSNQCVAAENEIAVSATDPRGDCAPVFAYSYGQTRIRQAPTTDIAGFTSVRCISNFGKAPVLIVSFPGRTGLVEVDVFDASGARVYRTAGSLSHGQAQIRLHVPAFGVYTVRVRHASAKIVRVFQKVMHEYQ